MKISNKTYIGCLINTEISVKESEIFLFTLVNSRYILSRYIKIATMKTFDVKVLRSDVESAWSKQCYH